jgi:hypothetical protein
MDRVEVLDHHGTVIEEIIRHTDPGIVTIAYSRVVLRRPEVHVRYVEGDELPGVPPKVIAQRFGDPCEAPCCMPLSDEWPELPRVRGTERE